MLTDTLKKWNGLFRCNLGERYLRRDIFAMKTLGIIVMLIVVALVLPEALAHAPLGVGENDSLATATIIPDPAKSWAIYSELHEGGEAQYYQFSIAEGHRIYVSLFASPESMDKGFMPVLVLMGPKIENQGVVPPYVEVPPRYGVMVVEGRLPTSATYEAFSPSSFYELAEVDLSAPTSGTYYVTVYEQHQGGRYGLALGYIESFTLNEWIFVPMSLLSIYQWSGQSILFILAPAVIVLVIGLGLFACQRRKMSNPLFSSIGTLAGLLFIGTGVTILSQMYIALTRAPLGSEIGITLLFASIPVLLGIGVTKLVLKAEKKIGFQKRVYLFCLGLLALFIWAGFVVGPFLVIVLSVVPNRNQMTPVASNK